MECRFEQTFVNSCITKVDAKPEIASEKNSKTMFSCIVESHEYTRHRAVKITLQVKDLLRCLITIWWHKFIPMPQAMKILDAKAEVDEEWKKARENSCMGFGKSQEQKGGYTGSRERDEKKVHFAILMEICHLNKCGFGTQITEVQRQSRAPRLWTLCSFC